MNLPMLRHGHPELVMLTSSVNKKRAFLHRTLIRLHFACGDGHMVNIERVHLDFA